MSAEYNAGLAAIESSDKEASLAILQQANNAYYTNGSSPLTDVEFDQLAAA